MLIGTRALPAWPSQQRIVVIEFPSMDQLKTWYDSPEYRVARTIAQTALGRRLLFVEGKNAPIAYPGVPCYRNDPNTTALQSNTSSLLLLKARLSRP
jgi:hypothetical protein